MREQFRGGVSGGRGAGSKGGEVVADREAEGLSAEGVRAGDEGGFGNGVGVEAVRVGGGGAEVFASGAVRGSGDEGGVQADEGPGGSRD